jgi:hypothetical protein
LHLRQIDADVPPPGRQLSRVGARPAAELEDRRSLSESREHLAEEPPSNLRWPLGVPGEELGSHPIVAVGHDAFQICGFFHHANGILIPSRSARNRKLP